VDQDFTRKCSYKSRVWCADLLQIFCRPSVCQKLLKYVMVDKVIAITNCFFYLNANVANHIELLAALNCLCVTDMSLFSYSIDEMKED